VDFIISENIRASDEVTNFIRKLQLNSFYGAVCRDKARAINSEIILNVYDSYIAVVKTSSKRFTIINNQTILIEPFKTKIYSNRFPVIASTILDLSKAFVKSVWTPNRIINV